MPTAGDPLALREARRVGVVGLAVAAAVTILSIVGTIGAPDPVAGEKALVTTGDHPHGPVAVLLDRSDGQTFAALARDPTLSRPEVFRKG